VIDLNALVRMAIRAAGDEQRLAEALGCNQLDLILWRMGAEPPPADVLAKLCDIANQHQASRRPLQEKSGS
jgi:hypothetical protein